MVVARVSLAKPASSATEGGPQSPVSAERPACLREVDSAMSVLFGRVLWDGLVFAGPDFQVCPVALEFGSAVSGSFGRALSVGLVCRAWVAVMRGGGRLVDFQDGWAPAGSRDDSEACSAGDDNPNCHGSLDGWPTQSVADDTRRAADDKDSTTRSSSRGCNRRGAIPSSIPIHPIPKAGYQPAAPQFRSPLRN